MPLRITTWNVNSVRPRLAGLERLVREIGPDVLCLQETKVTNDRFPVADLEALGFRHHALHGQAGYHGVAVFSKLPLEDAEAIAWCGKDDCRHLRLRLAGELELHNLYVPAGGRIPDPEINAKFAHKLEFLAALTEWFRTGFDPAHRAVLVGDLNIAPLPTDVWNHRALLKVVTHTPGRSRRSPPCRRRTSGSTRCAASSRRRSACSPGGATSRPTGRRRIAAAASTMSGSRPVFWIVCAEPRCCARRAAGRSPRTTCP
jgi:exodeoxyribonuclease III